MPGVDVNTTTRPGPAGSAATLHSTLFLSGVTERGAVDVVHELRSLNDYRRKLGDRDPGGAVYDQARTYFEELGPRIGGRVLVSRATGAAPVKATLTLEDSAAVDTIRIDALDYGTYANAITAQVAAGGPADTVTITITGYDGAEVYPDLATVADIVTALADSLYVEATNLGSITAAPGNLPAVLAATPLAGGTDDRATIAAADYIDALDVFDIGYGGGVEAIPGQTPAAVGAGLKAHAEAHDRLYYVAPAFGTSKAGALAAAAAAAVQSEAGELVYPWVRIPDGTVNRWVSPEGYAAAVRARAIQTEGPARAPAGELAIVRFVNGIEQEFDRADGDDLDAGGVSVIRFIRNEGGRSGIRKYGARSLIDPDDPEAGNYPLITQRDTLNFIAHRGRALLESFAFATIDGKGHALSDLHADGVSIVEPLRATGQLFERHDDEADDLGYSVDTSEAVNPIEDLRANKVRMVIAARPSPSAALVILDLVHVAVNAPV